MRVQMGIMTLAGPFQLNYNHPLKKTLCFTTLNSFYSFLCVKLLWLYRNQIDVYSELLGNKNMLYWPSKLLFSNTKMSSNICNVLFYFSIWLFSSNKCPLFYWHKFVKGFLLRTLLKFWTNKSMWVFISWANIFLPPMFDNKINRF